MFSHSLAGQFLCPWRQCLIRVGLGRYESQQALTQIGNKGEAGTRLKIPPWRSALNPLCLSGSVMVWELEPEKKDGKCCRSRQASTTAHISGTTVLLSNFWLQTAPKDALGGKACTGRSVPPRGWLGFIKAINYTRWENGQIYAEKAVTEKVPLWVNFIKNIVFLNLEKANCAPSWFFN